MRAAHHRLRLAVLLASVVLMGFPRAVFAHRLDEYLQAILVVIDPRQLRLQINLIPGVQVAGEVLDLIDLNHDGAISAGEAAAYADLLKSDLTAALDGRQLELKLTASSFPDPSELRTGLGIIELEFSAIPGALAPGEHTLTLQNRHFPAASVYHFNAAHPDSGSIQITVQERNTNQSWGSIAFTLQPPSTAPR